MLFFSEEVAKIKQAYSTLFVVDDEGDEDEEQKEQTDGGEDNGDREKSDDNADSFTRKWC